MEASQDIHDPWKVQTPSTVGNYSELFQNVDLPESFEKVFNLAQPSGEQGITVAALDKIIRSAGLPKSTTNKMLYDVLGLNQTHISKNELFIILGLIALAQKNMDATLENLSLYKNDLPEPLLPGLETVDFRSLKSPTRGSQSGFSDPWRISKPTTSEAGTIGTVNDSKSTFGKAQGFKHKATTQTSILPDTPDDVVEVLEAEELGGLIFKFVNYTVTSEVRACTVLRRYSDFYWLCEVLQKRYPYRMIPKLPPKKIGGNKVFFDDRRIRLSRFLNFLVVHPVLKEDSLVNAFLTEAMDMARFKRENTVHVFEEFEFSSLKTNFENLSHDAISTRVAKAQGSVVQATRHHEKMCQALERIRIRQQASGKDYLLYSQALNSLAEQELIATPDTPSPSPQVFSRFDEISIYLQKVSSIMCDGAGTPFDAVIEEFRRHHLLLDSLRVLLQRIPASQGKDTESDNLAQNIAKTRQLLADIEANTSGSADSQKLRQSLESDEAILQEKQKRSTFVLHCLWEELEFFHRRLGQTQGIYQRLVSLELDYNTQVSRIWKQLSTVVDTLPQNDDLFSVPIDSPASLQALDPLP
ncbi:Sorting nexin mvp1 [Entomophthora muscae]|uniref:Sorting nexin mvp1 n=1 Tax=Entomophthora muscae TaxID=34485 RepID=A0ACC2U355_9FUNG|nr:Sorting nexin mvp1 [Entomophthora muscae]